MSFWRGLAVQGEVVHALVLRETRTRFGAHQLGYVWALLEPLLMILTFYVLFSIGGRDAPYGMDVFGFIATGIVPYLLFRNAATRASEAINANRAMLFYPHVQPLDLVISRALLEAVTHLATFAVLMGLYALIQQSFSVDDLLLVLAGFALATLLGASFGLLLCGLGQLSNAVDRAKGPLMRPLFWVSGIFFSAASLPSNVRELMLWNPVLHVVELVRAGWYTSASAEFVRPGYVLVYVLAFAFFGLTLERVVRRRIELT